MHALSAPADHLIATYSRPLIQGNDIGGDMWKGRALALLAALLRPLAHLRDRGLMTLSAESCSKYSDLGELESLAFNHPYGPEFDRLAIPLRKYLLNLPGYQRARQGSQVSKTLDFHGYIVMQLGHLFTHRKG